VTITPLAIQAPFDHDVVARARDRLLAGLAGRGGVVRAGQQHHAVAEEDVALQPDVAGADVQQRVVEVDALGDRDAAAVAEDQRPLQQRRSEQAVQDVGDAQAHAQPQRAVRAPGGVVPLVERLEKAHEPSTMPVPCGPERDRRSEDRGQTIGR
jgi:hypothetical protein